MLFLPAFLWLLLQSPIPMDHDFNETMLQATIRFIQRDSQPNLSPKQRQNLSLKTVQLLRSIVAIAPESKVQGSTSSDGLACKSTPDFEIINSMTQQVLGIHHFRDGPII